MQSDESKESEEPSAKILPFKRPETPAQPKIDRKKGSSLAVGSKKSKFSSESAAPWKVKFAQVFLLLAMAIGGFLAFRGCF